MSTNAFSPTKEMFQDMTFRKYQVEGIRKLASVVLGDPKALFSIPTTPRCRKGTIPFPGLLHFTLDPYLIMLSVKEGSVKYHFLSLWYTSTWD